MECLLTQQLFGKIDNFKLGGLNMINENCIYFEEHEEDTGWNHCTRSSRLDNNGELCNCCRLWDSYIPKTATKTEIEKAQKWQNMSYDEQPDYDDYF